MLNKNENFPQQNPPAKKADSANEKKPFKFLGYGVEFWLIIVAVLVAIPYINLVALPIVLAVAAPILMFILWKRR